MLSVSITPGSTVLERMPFGPPSMASTRVICARAPSEAAWAVWVSEATTEGTEAIEPPRSPTRNASRAWTEFPRALTRTMASKSWWSR